MKAQVFKSVQNTQAGTDVPWFDILEIGLPDIDLFD